MYREKDKTSKVSDRILHTYIFLPFTGKIENYESRSIDPSTSSIFLPATKRKYRFVRNRFLVLSE